MPRVHIHSVYVPRILIILEKPLVREVSSSWSAALQPCLTKWSSAVVQTCRESEKTAELGSFGAVLSSSRVLLPRQGLEVHLTFGKHCLGKSALVDVGRLQETLYPIAQVLL